MELLKSADGRSVVMESYAIERSSPSRLATVRATLVVKTPSENPAEMRIQVEYEYDGFPETTEAKFGQRLLRQIERRVQSIP